VVASAVNRREDTPGQLGGPTEIRKIEVEAARIESDAEGANQSISREFERPRAVDPMWIQAPEQPPESRGPDPAVAAALGS
jgi:hypothetical protein